MEPKNYYDQLSLADKIQLAKRIEKDNLEKSNQFYRVPRVKKSFYTIFGKRMLDIGISFIAVVVSFPVNAIVGAITFFDVGRPIFFKQKRLGKDCKVFTIVKFRNMTNETDENGDLLRADLRVTKWGKFVRSTSMDELLNFINVLKGDMSIIGPRPLPEVYKGRFNSFHETRHKVRPGLDCPLRDPTKVMTWENRLENDVWYVENISFSTDMKMFCLLVREALFGKDISARAEGFSEGTFMGYYDDGRVMDSNHIPDKYIKEVIR